jgi:hypothetical protein
MTTVEPIDFSELRDGYWRYNDIIPAVYQPGATADETIELVRRWLGRKLVPYLAANFTGINSTVGQLENLVDNLVAETNGITGKFHADAYGLSTTATPDQNRVALAAAQADAKAAYVATGRRQTVIIPTNVYQVNTVPYRYTDGSAHGVVTVEVTSGVDWEFHGTIKLVDNAYTAGDLASGYGAVFRNKYGDYLSDAEFRGVGSGGIDGNRDGQPATASTVGVTLINAATGDNVSARNLTLVNATLGGVRFTGPTGGMCTNIRFTGNKVKNVVGIGLQCSNFDGLQILDNLVDGTGDNAIDIYGENGSATTTGKNFIIRGNLSRNAACGVFLETVSFGSCHDNVVINCGSGIRLNRINGEPQNVDIHDNTVNGGVNAFLFTGVMRSCSVHHNTARGFTGAGIKFGSGTSTTSNIDVDANTLDGATATTPLYQFSGTTVAAITVRNPRTFTVTDKTYLYVTDSGTTVAGSSRLAPLTAAYTSELVSGSSVPSGTVFNIPVPKSGSGMLTIEANSGGAWYSTWTGIVNGGDNRVDVAQLAVTGVTPGNAILTVVGSTTDNNVVVTLRATGSTMNYTYRYDRVS